MKIGFIDYYLDEWHANNYPKWIEQASGGEMTVAYAYGMKAAPSGKTSEQWCQEHGVAHCQSIEEVVEKSDLQVVLSPDHAHMHWALCQAPLRSGKPTYVDKTFAASVQEARALFDLAEEHGTPMFSSSALRFSNELRSTAREGLQSVVSVGPGGLETYLIHQVEPLVALFGCRATGLRFVGTATTPMFSLAFGEGKRASIAMLGSKSPCPFASFIQYADGAARVIDNASGYFDNFIAEMVWFFRIQVPPVEPWETIEVIRILEKAQEAANSPDAWIDMA